ncbi:MAG: amidase [Betaproteobacteria bacterium]|nr:MAG: amidase [Betaproteobacteria bacterium]
MLPLPPMRLSEITGSEAARRLAASETTSEALVAACLERIAERDEQVRAWAFIDRAAALAQARSLDRAPRRSRLHGVPFGIKDIIDTADLPTEYNSAIYRGHRPKADAACVTLLKQAGCVILGKTVTTEFANNHPSQTRNPHNGAHTPGGSSSGSAAAVADFMVPLALGTQTGGSVIRPAAYCGAYAMKPSFGAINRAGTKFLAESLDTIGIFARCAGDLALAMEVLTGRADTRPPAGAPRIGLCRTARWSLADAATQANVEQAARSWERAGAVMRDFELPTGSAELFDRHKVIMGYETARALGWEYQNHRSELSATLRARLEEGWSVPRAEYDAMREHARRLRRELAERLREVDFLITPSAPSEAPASLASTGDPVFNRAWTLLGVPCVTIPYGKGARGLPLAVQLVGAHEADMTLLGWTEWVARVLT